MSTNPARGSFHYDVDAGAIYSQGVVRVTSTGKVNGITRSVQVLVARGGATDFLYFTDFEDADPANTNAYPSGASTQCGGTGPTNANYWFEGRSGCTEITFVSGDQLDGQVHFNDTPLMSGSPTFLKGFETSDPGCKTATGPTYAGVLPRVRATPNYNGYKPVYAGQLNPPDNTNLFSSYPGCQYTGDTRDQVQRRRHDDGVEQEERWHHRRRGLRRPDHPGHGRVGDRPGPDRPGHLRQERQHAGPVHGRLDR